MGVFLYLGGNVGIGTTSPDESFHVEGNFKLQTSSGSLLVSPSASNSTLYTATGSPRWNFQGSFFSVESNETSAFIVRNSGNVGIGSMYPSAKLEVDGAVVATEFVGDGSALTGITSGGGGGTVGLVGAFPMQNCPIGWLQADGSEVSRTTYDGLFSTIGTMYGMGDGATTFALPDYRGLFLRGVDDGAGRDPDASNRFDRGDGTSGDEVGTMQEDALQDHRHDNDYNAVTRTSGNNNTGDLGGSATRWSRRTKYASESSGGGRTSSETRPANIYVTYCISYFGGVSGDGFSADGSMPMDGNIRLNGNWLSNDGSDEGIRVDNSGNVGIGTTSPSDPLDVVGRIRALGGYHFFDTRDIEDLPEDIPSRALSLSFKRVENVSSPPGSASANYAHVINVLAGIQGVIHQGEFQHKFR